MPQTFGQGFGFGLPVLSSFDVSQSFPVRATMSYATVLPAVDMYRNVDQTVTWDQPEDGDFGGYNGRCGETAAANIMSMLTVKTSPNEVAAVMYDSTPGTKPETLQGYLHSNAPGNWSVGRASPAKGMATLKYLLKRGRFKAANKNAPLAVLIQQEGYRLHWVTVVDVNSKNDVVINHNGIQESRSGADFLSSWGFEKPGAMGSIVDVRASIAATCCAPYTVVYQPE